MDKMKDLPMGFGMALLQNEAAARYFESLPGSEQQRIIEGTHRIESKAEMRAFVRALSSR